MAVSSTSLSGQMQNEMRGPSKIIWLVAAAVWIFVLWASFAFVDEIVRGDGEIISSSRPQIIQNLEGGILTELAVKEGDEVVRGDVLARLHGTQFRSSVDDLEDQIAALEIRRLRLEAELAGADTFELPADLIERSPSIVASERALLAARHLDYLSRRDGARRILNQAAQEKVLMEDLLDEKVVSLIEVTRARKAHADAQKAYEEIVTKVELNRAESYSDTLKELATLRQNLKSSQDQLDRTVLVAPMHGIVNDLAVTTIGGVVRPGEEIMQIIPIDEDLYVEARVAPENIANIRPGQQATIKLTAYDYTIYGTLSGAVTVISADTVEDDRRPDAPPHYKVTIRVDQSNLDLRQEAIEIRPGMMAQAELHTGKKTILQYLLKPLYKSREAFREP